MMRRLALLVLAALAVTPGTAAAQIPAEIAAKIREFGPVQNPKTIELGRALYAPLQPKPGSDVVVTKDIEYGPDERHRLDVFVPARKPAKPAPVVIFVHGGGYVGGAKSTPNTPFYESIGAFWARSRIIGVNTTYRLSPQHPWPAGGQDVADTVAWVRANIAQYGGDPLRIVLMGHSAGATHVATYLFYKDGSPEKQPWPLSGDGVVGAILLSGWYDPATSTTAASRGYFGDDASLYPARAAVRQVASRTVPVFIGFAEYDPPGFQVEAVNLFKAICERDQRCPPMKQAHGHNHMTQIYHLGTSDRLLSSDLVDFVQRLK